MSQRIVRLAVVGMAATLMLATLAGCFFGGGEEPEPTEAPDLAATIAAAVAANPPTDTPAPTDTPPAPTDTPVPPEPTSPPPDLAATVQAMIAATQAAVPPTAVPMPTDAPEPTPENTPAPESPARQRFEGPPCIVAGIVTIGGSIPPAGTPVYAVSQGTDGNVVSEDSTDTSGRYQLEIQYAGEAFDIFVRASDTGVDTASCASKGEREIKNLNIQ